MVPLRRWFHATGIFYFAWVIPGAVIVLVFGVSYLRFLFALPPRTRNLVIASAAIFVGGALGCELIGGAIAESLSFDSLAYIAIMTIEESLEMVGIMIFVGALLDYLACQFRDLHVTFHPLALPQVSPRGWRNPAAGTAARGAPPRARA